MTPPTPGIAVLKDRSQVEAAKRTLRSRGLGPRWFPEGIAGAVRYSLAARHLPPRPDWSKAWDLNMAIETIESMYGRDAEILDLGAYNSAIVPSLVRLGYRRLAGIDLDPRVKFAPYSNTVKYLVGDFHETPFPSESFQVVTAISTLEHGYDGNRLFQEIGRLLKPGGALLASTDYWPEKIDTSHVRPFGLSWTIFSRDEVQQMQEVASRFGLRPRGSVDLDAHEQTIEWSDRAYTFLYLSLVKP